MVVVRLPRAWGGWARGMDYAGVMEAGMPRLNRVTWQLASPEEPVVTSWDACRELCERARRAMEHGLVRTIEGVGTSSPVMLSTAEKVTLRDVLFQWEQEVSVPELPEGIWELRCVLVDDLNREGLGP